MSVNKLQSCRMLACKIDEVMSMADDNKKSNMQSEQNIKELCLDLSLGNVENILSILQYIACSSDDVCAAKAQACIDAIACIK